MLKKIIKADGKILSLDLMESNKKAIAETAWYRGYVVGVNEAGLRIAADPKIPSGERILDVQNKEPAAEDQEQSAEADQGVVHLLRDDGVNFLCRQRFNGDKSTNDVSKVTCVNCRDGITAEDQPAASEKPKIDPRNGIKA